MVIQLPDRPAGGGFAPFRQRIYAVLWVATVLGNIGTFMASLASSWLVTELSGSPAAVSMVQAASTLPLVLLSVPAGVLSDIFDRRKFLIGIQMMLGITSCALVMLSLTGLLTIGSLVGLSFVGGIGAALMGPTWQAIVPELVPVHDVRNAIALNSLGVNIARSIGPAVGGLLLAYAGAAATYGVDALSYVVVTAALLYWRRAVTVDDQLPEYFFGAFRAGLRYAGATHALHLIFLRSAVFFTFASALWGLLPLVARNLLGGEAGFYGVMLGAMGIGAIAAALVLPRLREFLEADHLLLLASLITALVMGCLAAAPPRPAALAELILVGGAWIVALTTFNGAAQSILPNWVRGRGLAMYLTVFNGAMTVGTLGWGLVAQTTSVRVAPILCALLFVLAAILLRGVKLPAGGAELEPAHHWPDPPTAGPVPYDRGPVLVLIEYRVAPGNRPQFLSAIRGLSEERRRDGATRWGITEDAAAPERVVEWFVVESWSEHLRQHRRVTRADADRQRDVARFHDGPSGPTVRHFLTLRLPR